MKSIVDIKSYIVDYTFKKDSIRLKIKIKTGKVLEYKNGRYAVILRGREKKNELELEVVSIDLTGGEFSVLVELNPQKYIEMFGSQVADVYLLDRHKAYTSRVSAKMLERDFEVYYSVLNKKFIKMYITEKGNFSIKMNKGGNEVVVSKAVIDRNGILSVEGFLKCDKLNSVGKSTNLKKIIVKNKANESKLEVSVDKFTVDELANRIEYTDIDCENAGFKFNINLVESGMNERKMSGKIYLVLGDEEDVEIELPQPESKINEVQLVEVEGNKSWILDFNNKKNMRFKLEDVSSDVEVREVYIHESSLEFVLNKSLNGIDYEKNKNIKVILRDRYGNKEYNIKSTVKVEETVKIIAYFDEFASRENIELDIYDVYLKIGNQERKVSSRYDGIMNKKEIVRFPRFYLEDTNGKDLAIEPYYTDSNNLALKIKKMMEIKNIESVETDSKGIRIKGKMYIRKPLVEGENGFSGVLTVDVGYGVKINLVYIAKVELVKGALVQYDFEICIPKKEIKDKGYSVAYVAKNLSNKVVFCSVDSTPERRSLVLNIKSENIKTTLEDKIQKTKIGNKIVSIISVPMYNVFNKIMPMNNNLIVFQSYYGKSYSCNPRAIYEELLDSGRKYKCVWVLNDVYKELPGLPKIVKPKSLAYYYYMSRAKYFVNNANFPDFYKKRKNAINIQTWHGTPLKKIGLDVEEGAKAYKSNTSKELLNRVKRWDSLIVPNRYTGEILSRAYEYENEILELGYPRNDVFYKKPHKKEAETKRRLGIPEGKKIIMYAPTWRENQKRTGSYKLPFSIDEFKQLFGDDYVLLLRLHYFDASRLDELTDDENIKNVSFYDDIAELYLISDILVTDYSSVMFDYANSKKPILFYTYDLDVYVEELRGLYFDFEKSSPGPLIKTEKELFNAIKNIDQISDTYNEKYSCFVEKFCSLEDGHAAERVVEKIFKK